MKFKKALLLLGCLLVIPVLQAGTIRVAVKYENGQACKNCEIKSSWDFKKTYTDRHGRGRVDVGTASKRVTLYVHGNAGACARAGDSVTILVRLSGGLLGSSVSVHRVNC